MSSSSSSLPPSSSKMSSAAVLLRNSKEEEEEQEENPQKEWMAHHKVGTDKETNDEEEQQEQETNTRTKEFRRGRHHHHNIRPRNPFSERQRNNFPNWEDVFATEEDTAVATAAAATTTGMGATRRRKTTTSTTSSSSTIIKATTTTTSITAGSDAGASSSSSSSSSLASTSILNMSIGARAALNEHLRHVHKYGIDGEKRKGTPTKTPTMAAGSDDDDADDADADHNHNDINNYDTENDIGIPAPPTTTRRRTTATTKTATIQSSLDHHWESLLDSSFQVNTSFGPGSSISINSISSSVSQWGSAGAGILVGAVGGTGRRSSSADVPSHHHQQQQDQHGHYHHNNKSSSSNENSMEEVMTDVSNDFFNSSRVEQLLTPERNKDRLVEVIVARGSNNVSILESSIEEEAAAEEEGEEAEVLEGSVLEGEHVDAGYYNFLHQLPPLVTRGGPESTTSLHSSSFHHLSGDGTAAVDLSRISSNFGSDHGGGRSSDGPQTPLPSFDEDGGAGGHHPLGLDEPSFSPIQSVSSPFRIDTSIKNNNTSGHDSSSLSSSGPYKKMPSFPATMGESGLSPYSQQHNGSSHSPQMPIVEGLHHQQPLSGWQGRSQDNVPESNASTPGYKHSSSASASSSLHSTISSMINEASSFVNYVTQEVELSMEAIESLPNDFFKAMDIGGGGGGGGGVGTQNDGGMDNGSTPSPISPIGSNSSNSNSSSPENKQTKPHHLPTQTKRPTIYGRERGLSGRHRYRTVVPRRVYIGPSPSEDDEHEEMDGQQNHQPELHVSFDIQSNPETSRTNRSLLESFEEAIHRTF